MTSTPRAPPSPLLIDMANLRAEEGFKPFLAVADRLPEHNEREILIDIGVAKMGSLHDALARADRILMPASPSRVDVWSIRRLLTIVRAISAKAPGSCTFGNCADTHPAARENAEIEAALRQLSCLEVLPVRLAQDIVFHLAFSEGLAIVKLKPSGEAS